ncbi:MAG: hypothetical protein ACK4SF_00570 [Algoriphagus aquaeductus]|jgi:hypothetical protein|uniref:Uncharacterized protein n=1 Tax=Algoriphagus aquaeductus TaxID=475299 RepID=A0A326RVP4_9BACT|nr:MULTISPECIES: hypothetical protein [Algoriphagus]PZV86326.1 hypothetical protein CLV31_102226 [Algoriphagus aquaeductus]
MKHINWIILILGFIVGAIGYWTADFSEEKALYESVFYIKAPGAFIAVLIAGLLRKKEPAQNALRVTFGVMLGMLSRILFDMTLDPSSHNLFPFELMIGLVIVMPAAFVGSYLIYGVFFLAGKN